MQSAFSNVLEGFTKFLNEATGLTVPEAASVVTLALFIWGLSLGVFKLVKLGLRVIGRFREKLQSHKYEGLYRSDIYDVNEKIIQVSDVIQVSKTLDKFEFRPIYLRSKKFNYSVILQERESGILEGPWSHQSGAYYGSAMLSPSQEGLDGYMLGNNKTGKSNVLTWKLARTNIKKRDLISSRFSRFLGSIQLSKEEKEAPIKRLIEAHQAKPKSKFNYKELEFNIERPVCNPDHSTFSRKLLEEFEIWHPSYKSVLDLGCGCGFYAIYLRSLGVKQVTAVDFPDAIRIAKNNAFKNLKTNERIDFRDAKNDQVFMPFDRREKFDVILANLPFSSTKSNIDYVNSKYFRCFAASEELVFNLILGAKLHLNPNGALYFPFGETGDLDQLNNLIKASGLTDEVSPSFKSDFSERNYQIYRLSRD